MAPRCHAEHPCLVPPHPDLIARTKAEASLKVQGVGNDASFRAQTRKFIAGERRFPGQNDGTIFPKTHFKTPTSVMAMSQAAADRAPLRGALKVAIVLAEFSDVKMAAGTKQRFQDLFFSKGKVPTGSVTEYFSEVSNGKISLSGEVVGPFTLSKPMSYYSNGNYGYGWPEPNSQTMANEALDKAIGQINFAPYDNDGNGYVDAYVVVHAGRAADETGNKNDIWSIKWTLPNERQVNGVKVYGFLSVAEDAKCGVCAHEIGHLVFGWPDLYDTDYSSAGIGSWCLMSFGSWGGGGYRPVHPSAWCKASQGWIETVNETENRQVTLKDVKSGLKTHRLWKNGDASSKEYFLIENRQLTGFDGSLPGAGLLVWHIDDNQWSNTDENRPWVKILQADGLDQLKANNGGGDGGDPFPGIANNVSFTATSNPNSKDYAGNDTFVSITNIPQPSETITFNITVKPVDQPPTGDFDSKQWYRLKNTYNPNSYSLAVINDGGSNSTGRIQMQRDSNDPSQFWQIKSNSDGTYFIRNLFLGANRRLDVYGDDKTKPVVGDAAGSWGEYWTIKPWGDGTWYFWNGYSGQNLYLDTMEGSERVALNGRNEGRPTQRWTAKAIRQITETGF